MYRSRALTVALLTLACSPEPGGRQSSDTARATAGPLSSRDGAGGGLVSSAQASPASDTGHADRVPNELGRIMVVEYHLIGDQNTTYTRETSSTCPDPGHF